MGFDLYGVNPKIKEGTKKPKEIDWRTATEEERDEHFKAVDEFESINKGVYFRNNVWWWRRLADYVLEHTKCVDKADFDKWQHNDGHEVDAETAEQIANQLEHNNKVEQMLSELRLEVAKIVGEKKAESLAPRDYPEPYHKKWNEIYSQTDYRANYPFSIDNVKEFIEFARNSGGFRIC